MQFLHTKDCNKKHRQSWIVIENPDVAQALRQDKNQNLQYLKDNYNLTLDQITALYNYGKFQYSYGNYSGAADYLYHFRVLSTDPDLTISAQWGKLASDILTGKWDVALEELNSLREAIDSRTPAPFASVSSSTNNTPAVDPALSQLHSRTWLVHWSLFVYFNHPQGRALLLETFLSPTYLNTIQTSCPWILRYVAAAAIISSPTPTSKSSAPQSSRVKNAVREVVKVIQMENYQYTDPVTAFLTQLHVEFDFEAAQKELQKAEKVVSDDFFLGDFHDEFLESARCLVSEAHCRIHQRIDIGDLSDRLNLPRDEGEKWIVNLIRETRMGQDAKIDLEKNLIQISRPPQPVYQSVIEKTRGLAIRTQALGAAIARSGAAAAQTAPQSVEPVAVS
ncbi:eukaryotic translation initiation factor 3 subunit 6 [Lentinula guzmanii]|uniref:Eukaryotic translation initiation factor 3 subunit E n=1 Tax=Lentinula guzmanii TaxID=2804957 RepID=A0AA38N3F9_9AGAR|nr:eukaryotic translation initiation factor 3 subunit 6 [Lentinula guzmanii]